MKDLVKFIKESLLDMDEPDESMVKERALLELFKEYLQYTDKTNNSYHSAVLIFHKKYDHKRFEKITKEFKTKLLELGLSSENESGSFEQGSLKVYYNDYEFKLDNIVINVDFSYSYQKAIVRKGYVDVESELPDHGVMEINVFSKFGRKFLRLLKKELLIK